MNEEMFVATLTKDDLRLGSSRSKKKEIQEKKKERDEKIQKERELNPHWKDDGTGLPEKTCSSENLSLPSTSVGDGGYSYLKKAYYRIQEQAQHEGRSMEEIAVERWGSLDKLISLITVAEERMNQNIKTKYNSDKHRWKDRNERKPYSHFHKPSADKSPSLSPERSYLYEKPKHCYKKEKKVGHFSSSDRKQNIITNELDNQEKYRSPHTEKYPFLKTSDFQEQERNSRKTGKHIPAWKKIKTSCKEGEDVHKETGQNFFVWDKQATHDEEFSENRSLEDVSIRKNTRHSPEIFKSHERTSSEVTDNINKVEKASGSNDIPIITSEDDLNKLAAQLTKAELLGNATLASKLKQQLEDARHLLKAGGNSTSSQRKTERVLLTKLDSTGQERPIHYSNEISETQSKQNKKQSQRFFDDGSRYSLKQMFEREKLTTTYDNMEMFMDVAGQCNDADDDNETSGISKKATNKMAHHLQEQKDVGKAVQQHQKRNTALEKCNYCLDQPNMKRHLIVNKFKQVYLCIPDFQSLVEGHCLIVPKRHVPSFLMLDEEEWREVEDVKCRLRNMFLQQNQNVIFLETSRTFKYFPHAYIEVIPVSEEISDMAPLYFKKAILESETEWANNVKLIDLSKKSLRHSVPDNLPYFCVQFDPKVHSGYAHVIEDDKDFERNFGKEVIGGMLDIDYNYLFKNRKEDPTKKSKETLKFLKMWENFNKSSS